MKSIQILYDENLLARLDKSEEVRKLGRSEVLQGAGAAAEYLERQRQNSQSSEEIAAQYRQAYGRDAGLGSEFEAWEDQGSWPSESTPVSKE